jgi:hypothetical protein
MMEKIGFNVIPAVLGSIYNAKRRREIFLI